MREEWGGKFLYKIMMKMPDGVPLPDGYDIVRCGICGSCYADTPASAKDICSVGDCTHYIYAI